MVVIIGLEIILVDMVLLIILMVVMLMKWVKIPHIMMFGKLLIIVMVLWLGIINMLMVIILKHGMMV